ncbi:SDR family NAD(P)-dependent oxidoreductase [Rhizobium sp. AB2/73]|uniref:NAD-dependent epimerase/dehydratase family protein n=1 Tax=Rhizobium sp. AB2/73 TaxID=2795216 RepID=UPI001C5DD81A|nr:SDR family NAD(P)-dependent oxidoreductase [Rhizobium sp. AB2/73]QYA13661.1 SDR family NAD(P)-dependent oxidoreductase [Rhizobium sp. AB2/73]UEQ80409.1 SDR family NAD(P)-dependent oxidoreductase [Rhizobium sp. AB2/73]
MKKTTILTGGAGFIGSRVAAGLANSGDQIVVIDNMHPQIHKTADRPEHLPNNVELIVADVTDADVWDRLLVDRTLSTVVHLAAETGTGQSLTESNRHAMVNVVGTTQMLDAFGRNDRIPEHIILTSSRAVYGEGAWKSASGEVFYPGLRDHAVLEAGEWDICDANGVPAKPVAHRALDIFPKPASIYGATKLAQEQIISCWASAMGIPATIFRFQNVYGPGQSPFNPYTGIITLFHRIASAGGTIEVYEDGQVGRDFVYIDDVVEACLAAVRRKPNATRCLDVGTGVATTIAQASQIISELYSAPSPRITGKFRDGDIRWAIADTDDLQAALGVRCTTDFALGARRVGEWLKAEKII